MQLAPPIPTPTVPAVANPRQHEVATFGAVHLEVTDLSRSSAFWHDVIGLHLHRQTPQKVELGSPDEVLVTLHTGAEHGFLDRHSGLYHLAIHPPTETEFARILKRLVLAGLRISPVDHIMSKAIYLNDPDGITVEITLETPHRMRELVVNDDSVQAVRTDGIAESGRELFDVLAMLDILSNNEHEQPVAPGTKIGHVHLYVDHLLTAYQFYRSLGFTQALWAPQLQVGDLGAGGAFNHRIAVNTWQGVGVPQSPAGTARMRNFTLRLDTPEHLDHFLGTVDHDVTESPSGYQLKDPAGNSIVLSN